MLLIPTRLEASRIHGLGVVTTEPVAAGCAIWRFEANFDACFGPEQICRLPAPAREFLHHFAYLDRATNRWVLNGDHGRFMNHSESPNTGLSEATYTAGAGPVITVALCDLPAGTELTCDYREFDGDFRRKLGV